MFIFSTKDWPENKLLAYKITSIEVELNENGEYNIIQDVESVVIK